MLVQEYVAKILEARTPPGWDEIMAGGNQEGTEENSETDDGESDTEEQEDASDEQMGEPDDNSGVSAL